MNVKKLLLISLSLVMATACSHVSSNNLRKVANDGNETGNRPQTAAQLMTVKNHCEGPANFKMFGDDRFNKIHSIKSFDVNQGPEGFDIKLVLKGKTSLDATNGDSQIAKEYTERFFIKESKTGMLYELSSSQQNVFKFNSIFLRFGDYDVMTAGPIPEGTHPLNLELVLVIDKPDRGELVTVKKLLFNCQSEVKYPSMP